MASESFLDDSMSKLMESYADSENYTDRDPIKCSCKNTCMSRRCPCRALQRDCNDSCKCGTNTKSCKNNKPVSALIFHFIYSKNISSNNAVLVKILSIMLPHNRRRRTLKHLNNFMLYSSNKSILMS